MARSPSGRPRRSPSLGELALAVWLASSGTDAPGLRAGWEPSSVTVNPVMGDADADDARWDRLVADLNEEVGRVSWGRDWLYPRRGGPLRAMLAVIEQNPAMRAAVYAQVRADAARRVGPVCVEIVARGGRPIQEGGRS